MRSALAEFTLDDPRAHEFENIPHGDQRDHPIF
jgi:hypothetical protein